MRSLKILKILGLHYDGCIRRFYRSHPHVKELPYREHLAFLERYCPVHLNDFSAEMAKLGHKAEVVVYDLETLQHRWAMENGFAHSPGQWRVDILLEQIRQSQPDVVFLQDVHSMPHFVRKRLKQLVPSIRKVVLFKGFPGSLKELADIDLVFAGTPLIQQDYDNEGLPTRLLYHAFDPSVLHRLESRENPRYQASFIGYSGYGGHGDQHTERYRLLKELAEASDLHFWITESDNPSTSPFASDPTAKPFSQLYPSRAAEGCFGLEMYQILKDSAVVFNKHTEAAYGMVGNMRLFETTGVGACLLTDTGLNMKDLFEEDREIVVYRNRHECLEKMRYLIDHPAERSAIAQAGQDRALRDHSLAQRCSQIDEALQGLF